MRIGIVGSEAAKFTPETEARAKSVIRSMLNTGDAVISGGCHLGGIDIWAAEIGREMQLEVIEHLPTNKSWAGGYKARNLAIVRDSDKVVCITVAKLPDTYTGMRFPLCYHCKPVADKLGIEFVDHVKSGGCWTMHQARKAGKGHLLVVI